MINISTDINNTFDTVITVSLELMNTNINSIPNKNIINGVILTPPYEAVVSDNMMMYQNIYYSYLENNSEAHTFLLLVLKAATKGQNITFMLSNDELTLPYMEVLISYIFNKYGIDVLNNLTIVDSYKFLNLYIEFYMNKYIGLYEFVDIWFRLGKPQLPEALLYSIWNTYKPYGVNCQMDDIYMYLVSLANNGNGLKIAIRGE